MNKRPLDLSVSTMDAEGRPSLLTGAVLFAPSQHVMDFLNLHDGTVYRISLTVEEIPTILTEEDSQ